MFICLGRGKRKKRGRKSLDAVLQQYQGFASYQKSYKVNIASSANGPIVPIEVHKNSLTL